VSLRGVSATIRANPKPFQTLTQQGWVVNVGLMKLDQPLSRIAVTCRS
jgi:hypothetical protein